MGALVGYTMQDGRGFYCPVGSVSFDEMVALVGAAIAMARSSHASDLLIDTLALSGLAPPSTTARFTAAVEWSQAAVGLRRIAVVARADLIDPQKFGVLVARNRGLEANIFTTRAEALAWLDANRVPRAAAPAGPSGALPSGGE